MTNSRPARGGALLVSMMTDTHCHLTDPVFRDNIDDVVAAARAAGVDRFVVPSVDLATSMAALDLAARMDCVLPAVGIHPMWADFADRFARADAISAISGLLAGNRGQIAAVGEIGLDPHINDERPDAGRETADEREARLAGRKEVFLAQMEMARAESLPVLLHWRGSYGRGMPQNETMEDLVGLLEAFGPLPAGGILHAFTGSAEIAARLRRLGWLRGVAGTVTRPDTPKLRKAIAETALADMVLETDAPFIANSVHARGLVMPEDLRLTAVAIAEIKGIDIAEVATVTDLNAAALFGGR